MNDGGSAFPLVIPPMDGHTTHVRGMTLRDWFAGQALAGQLAHDSLENCDAGEMARESYRIADAMLKARGMQ